MKRFGEYGFGQEDVPSSSTADRFHEGPRSAMWHWAFATLGEIPLKNNRHVDRHSGQKHVAARDSKYLISVLGIEDLKFSCHDFRLTRTFLKFRLDLGIERFNTAFRRKGEDSP